MDEAQKFWTVSPVGKPRCTCSNIVHSEDIGRTRLVEAFVDIGFLDYSHVTQENLYSRGQQPVTPIKKVSRILIEGTILRWCSTPCLPE